MSKAKEGYYKSKDEFNCLQYANDYVKELEQSVEFYSKQRDAHFKVSQQLQKNINITIEEIKELEKEIEELRIIIKDLKNESKKDVQINDT